MAYAALAVSPITPTSFHPLVPTRTQHVSNLTSFAANILPPPDDLTLPIVKLLTDPMYRSYQSHTASLSLFANLFVNFLPPAWGAPTPPTPPPPPPSSEEAKEEDAEKSARLESKEAAEWKRRIKMYRTYPSLPRLSSPSRY